MSGDGKVEPDSGTPADEDLARYRDGDVIRFEPRELPGKTGGRPLTVQFEIEVATGKRGEIVSLAQTAAIRDVLDWLSSRKPGKDESEGPGTAPQR
jgi:hypothetical protein